MTQEEYFRVKRTRESLKKENGYSTLQDVRALSGKRREWLRESRAGSAQLATGRAHQRGEGGGEGKSRETLNYKGL